MKKLTDYFSKIPKSLFTAAALSHAAQHDSIIADAIGDAMQAQAIELEYRVIGATSQADIDRMRHIVSELAKTTICPNREVFRLAQEFNRQRMLEGETLLPDDIRAWAIRFFAEDVIHLLPREILDAGMSMIHLAGFVKEAELIWYGKANED